MRPRCVLHVTRQLNYGCAVVLDQLAKNLDRNRYEPVIAFETNEQSTIRKNLTDSSILTIDTLSADHNHASQNPKPDKPYNISKLLEMRFGKKTADTYLSLKSAFRFARHQAPKVRFFLNLIREQKIDLVHTHSNISHAKPELVAARLAGIPCVAHAHAYMEPTQVEKILSKWVDAYIYISNDIAEHHYRRGFPRSNGRIIHNGVDLKRYPENGTSKEVRSEFNIKADHILIGLIGRIDWWKGHEYFLEAFAEAANKTPALRGIVIGAPSTGEKNLRFYKMLREKSAALNLKDKLIFTGYRQDVPRLIAAIDIVVHASSEPEPFGLVAIEGMASGKPVVATEAGGILDIIQNNVNGLLVPCKDSKAMAEAIMELAFNKKKAEDLGRAARQRIVDKFTIKHQTLAVEKLYDSLLSAMY
jgi:glycosyltransferase involved in cell wall biosynthesis